MNIDDIFRNMYKDDPEALEEFEEMAKNTSKMIDEHEHKARLQIISLLENPNRKEFLESKEPEYIDSIAAPLYRVREILVARFSVLNDVKQDAGKRLLLEKLFGRNDDTVVAELKTFLSLPTKEQLIDAAATFSEEKVIQFERELRNLVSQIDASYHRKMEGVVFTRSRTKLKELILKHPWKDVEPLLLKTFPDNKEVIGEYKRVYGELQLLPAWKNEDRGVITVELHEGYEPDISLVKPGEKVSYAIEFARWEEWLGYYVSQNDIEAHGELAIVVNCLWEMTYTGYYQSEIQEDFQEMIDRVDEITEKKREEEDRH